MKPFPFIMILSSIITFNSVCAQQKQDEKAHLWMKNSPWNYFNNPVSMSELTAARYTEFATDAMGIEYGGGLSEQNFITGDFNGDQKPDTLTVSFISSIDHTPIVIDTVSHYDLLIQKIIDKKSRLQLISSNLRTLNLNEGNLYILGLDVLQNTGNINTVPGDEIAVILRAADWSNINTCSLYTYSRSGWIKFRETEIREEEIPDIRTGKSKPWKK